RGRVLTDDELYMDYASVGSVQIGGPYQIVGAANDTPSRRAMFVCQPRGSGDEHSCAARILSRIARLAYRRPAVKADVDTLLEFFDKGRAEGGSFDAGVQFALERALVDHYYLLDYIHHEPMRGMTALYDASTYVNERSWLDLLRANYTFVNERLARHYRIPGVYGSRFRRVTLPNPDERGGLLANAAVLATTSYPDRTSPVLRGKWLLNNIFGLQVPPPPPGVDTNLGDTRPGARPPAIRERLAQHRRDS